MAKRRTLGIVKVRFDDVLYLDDAGEWSALRAGEWVGFKRRISMKQRRFLMSSFQADAENPEMENELASALADVIVTWNLSDLDADPSSEGVYPPMEKPSAESIVCLSDREIVHIFEGFTAMLDAESDPKN